MKPFLFSQLAILKIAIASLLSLNINLLISETAKAQQSIPNPLPDSVKQLVLNKAAQNAKLPVSELQIVSVQSVFWPNGCMGKYTSYTDKGCTQVIIDGWSVEVMSKTNKLTYHTTGFRAFLANTIWIEPMLKDVPPWLIGQTQNEPLLPNLTEGQSWIFKQVPSGRWYDPPTNYGFRYTMLENSLFTEILDFPTNIDDDNLFTVSVNNTILGQFSPGQSVNFVSLLGQGVAEFSITDINSVINPKNPTAFPLKIDFNTSTASFKMESISEPTSVPESSQVLGLMTLGLLGVCSRISSQKGLNK